MKKANLKNGMIVVTRSEKVGIILNDIICGLDWWNPLSFYNEDLQTFRYKFESEAFYNRGGESDIVEVYSISDTGVTLNSLLDKEFIRKNGERLS